MRKLASIAVLLGVIVGGYFFIPNAHQGPAKALLNESGAAYQLISCSGEWTTRRLRCEIKISQRELDKLIDSLELDQPLPYADPSKRIIYVDAATDPSAAHLLEKYRFALAGQQWSPSRNSFASAFLFYNKSTQRACLYLDIAYG